MEVRDVRNIEQAHVELAPGLNVFQGRNAQGKTSLLEAVALLARGRSFRCEHPRDAIRRGAACLSAQGLAFGPERETALEVQIAPASRRYRVNGRDVAPHAYQGRLDVVVYSTERLRVVHGSMKERRQYLDRGAAALSLTYRRTLREYERIVQQRNAALQAGRTDVDAWSERLLGVGAALRQRRGEYVRALQASLDAQDRPDAESYAIGLEPDHSAHGEEVQRATLADELAARRRDEQRLGRSLVGPHRDQVRLSVDGADAAGCSSGQARSLLLALTLASLELYRRERGSGAVALLDDLDSELDEQRTLALCRTLAVAGQALVTTAHPGWAKHLPAMARRFEVEAGRVREAS